MLCARLSFIRSKGLSNSQVKRIIEILHEATADFPDPMSLTIVDEYGRDPFLVLVSCLLSLRARDTMTLPLCRKLFQYATTPQEILALDNQFLESLLFSIGYYKQKTKQLKEVCAELITRFGGKVPHTEAKLLSIKGIGRKTANLVLSIGFEQPAICVDVHVHRISNRLGIIKTRTPEETEYALQKIVPRDQWGTINKLFIKLGQNICVPISPKCSICPLQDICQRVGVTTHR